MDIDATTGSMTKGTDVPQWSVRALQLDLARHMETVSFIKRYIDHASDSGFNMLALYLEGRVRTEIFPFRPLAETYSLKEMEDVVAHAASKRMDVLPMVSTLGHCENFLSCGELAHLSETRGGIGRWGKTTSTGNVLCPSMEETYAFLETYLTELAQAFPGGHFHAGMDEAWDLGFCDLCRKRWRDDGLSSIFTGHVKRMEGILASLGKRMWLWDDFYEFFPEELARTPKNIVLCHWGYEDLVEPEGKMAHFANRLRLDWLALYKKLGVDAVICPRDINARNIETFTAYGRKNGILGGLLTQWEVSPRLYPPGQTVLTGFAGRLWSRPESDSDEAWRGSLEAALPEAPEPVRSAAGSILRTSRVFPSASSNSFLAGQMAGDERLSLSFAEISLAALKSERALHMKSQPCDSLDFLEWWLRMERAVWNIRDLYPQAVSPSRTPLETATLLRRAEKALEDCKQLWLDWESMSARLRLDEHPHDRRCIGEWMKLEGLLIDIIGRLSAEPSSDEWLLILRLFLQDFYSAPKLRAVVLVEGKELIVADGSFKPYFMAGGRISGHYSFFAPFKSELRPESIRLEGGGYGGQGVSFLELQSPSLRLKPSAVVRTAGLVDNPAAVLKDDAAYALLGGSDTAMQFLNPELLRIKSILEIKLA